TTSHYRQEPGAVDVRLVRTLDAGQDALPSYAEFLHVQRLAQSEGGPIRFRRMADEAADEPAAAGIVQKEGTTTITSPDGTAHQVEVVTVCADGAVANSHWVADGQVLGSDWNGATSWLVDGPQLALDGLPEFMVAFLCAGFDS